MAIAFDVESESGVQSASSWSQSHTITGANPFLWVQILSVDTPVGIGAPTATAVDWGGASLLKLDTQTMAFTGINFDTYLDVWYLKAPGTGTKNINVTMSRAAGASGAARGTGMSYTGVHQTSPIDNHTPGTSGSNSIFSLGTTVIASNGWLIGAAFAESGTSVSSNNAQTFLRGTLGSSLYGVGDSNGVVGTGSQTMSWLSTTNTPWIGSNLSIAPAVAGLTRTITLGTV